MSTDRHGPFDGSSNVGERAGYDLSTLDEGIAKHRGARTNYLRSAELATMTLPAYRDGLLAGGELSKFNIVAERNDQILFDGEIVHFTDAGRNGGSITLEPVRS